MRLLSSEAVEKVPKLHIKLPKHKRPWINITKLNGDTPSHPAKSAGGGPPEGSGGGGAGSGAGDPSNPRQCTPRRRSRFQ